MSIKLESPAFAPGDPIPRAYSGEGANHSPPLQWSGLPEGTRELALICDDPDAPTAEPFVHWVLYGLPGGLDRLGERENGGGLEGMTHFGRPGYGGPMPPRGHGVHRYHFKLYALDEPLGAPQGLSKKELLAAMQGHVLGTGELIGSYERRG